MFNNIFSRIHIFLESDWFIHLSVMLTLVRLHYFLSENCLKVHFCLPNIRCRFIHIIRQYCEAHVIDVRLPDSIARAYIHLPEHPSPRLSPAHPDMQVPVTLSQTSLAS